MSDWLLLAVWLILSGTTWHCKPSYRGRMITLSILMLLGHMIAAGLASGRNNPLHTFDGSYKSILILEITAVILAFLACAKSLPDTRPLHRWYSPAVFCYIGLTVFASFFGYTRYIQAINFSLKWEHLRAPSIGVLLILSITLTGIAILLLYHLIEAAKQKQLYYYLGFLILIIGGVTLVTWLLSPRYYLHIHHSVWSLFLVFLFRYEKWWSRYAQALALGIFIDGLASWGITSIWHLNI